VNSNNLETGTHNSQFTIHNSEVVIIGAGPAGIATAIQLRRYNIEPVLLEREKIGGLLGNANLVENYPGFPGGISGLELVELFKKQLKNTGVKVNFENVMELEYEDGAFFTRTNKRAIKSNIIVIATGTKPRKNSGFSISDEIKERVFYEIYPILGIKNKKIAVIGAGDAAFDYSLNLCRKNEVTILNRREQTKCIPVLRERCKKYENISYLSNTKVIKINNKGSKLLLTCTSNKSSEKIKIKIDYVIAALGRDPCLDYLGCKIKKKLETLINTNKLYMVGDVNNGIYRQTAISLGDGIKAAMEIYRTIGSKYI